MGHSARIAYLVTVGLVVASLALVSGCGRGDGPEPSPGAGSSTPVPVVLGRDDMAALPGAEVDLKTLEDFPYHLRQESRMAPDTIFGYYDEFFASKGWDVERSVDPVTSGRVHRYRLADELAFVTVTPLDTGGVEVVLSRRSIRDDER
jgi:hypothetical protein